MAARAGLCSHLGGMTQMTGLRNDLRAAEFGLAVLAAAAICLATTTAAADDLDPKVDPMIAAIDAFIAELATDKSDQKWKSKVPVPGATAAFDSEKTYYWNLETNRGDLKIELFPKSAPLHVLSTIYLTRLGFYDDVSFTASLRILWCKAAIRPALEMADRVTDMGANSIPICRITGKAS